MRQKIKNFVLLAIAALTFGAPALVPSLAYANNITSNACSGADSAAGTGGAGGVACDTSSDASGSIKKVAAQLVNIFSIVVGVAAVIMIIFGGFKYITSGGDSNNVSGAKNTLIYAIVGLIVVALAQFIVHYVLTTTTNSLT